MQVIRSPSTTMVKMIDADIVQIDAGWEGSECHPIN